jgi:hypothetical protein
MRELSESESRILLSLLEHAWGVQPARHARDDTPSSTFYSVKQKAYDGGWVIDRYLPNPWKAGIAIVEVTLATPKALEFSDLVTRWALDPETVVLWTGLNSIFAVFFRKPASNSAPQPVPHPGKTSIRLSPCTGSAPVFFDYSGMWSHFIGSKKSATYPRPLATLSDRAREVNPMLIQKLVCDNPCGDRVPAKPHRWMTPHLLPRNLRKLIRGGAVQSRTVLNLESIPPFQGKMIGDLVFFTGTLRRGAKASTILAELNERCGIYPYLLVEDEDYILIGTVGGVDATSSKNWRFPQTRHPALDSLRHVVDDLNMVIERADTVRKLIDHAYGRVMQNT